MGATTRGSFQLAPGSRCWPRPTRPGGQSQAAGVTLVCGRGQKRCRYLDHRHDELDCPRTEDSSVLCCRCVAHLASGNWGTRQACGLHGPGSSCSMAGGVPTPAAAPFRSRSGARLLLARSVGMYVHQKCSLGDGVGPCAVSQRKGSHASSHEHQLAALSATCIQHAACRRRTCMRFSYDVPPLHTMQVCPTTTLPPRFAARQAW